MRELEDDIPAGYRDADIEQAEFEAEGRRESQLRKRGICTHGWYQGQPNGNDGLITCLHCGATFLNMQAHQDARDQARRR